jgi:uncharacterized protein YceK
MNRLIVTIVMTFLFSGCSAIQKQADGRYFDIASNNNSEASIFLEKVIVDGKWSSGTTGIKGCGGSNINGGGGRASPPYNTLAPQKYIYLEWYDWHEGKRIKSKIDLPRADIINNLLLNPPWATSANGSSYKSSFIIDFRPDNKVWIKLAKTLNPESEDEVMIIAEGKGIKSNDVVTKYIHYDEGEDYTSDCISKRKRLKKLGYYTAPLVVYDRWYPGAPKRKERR